MTVAELIEILNDEPQDAVVYAAPAYPNSAGLKPEDREPCRITGWSQTNYAYEGKPGEVYLEVFTDLDGCIDPAIMQSRSRFAELTGMSEDPDWLGI